jgi:hypothetical protein
VKHSSRPQQSILHKSAQTLVEMIWRAPRGLLTGLFAQMSKRDDAKNGRRANWSGLK